MERVVIHVVIFALGTSLGQQHFWSCRCHVLLKEISFWSQDFSVRSVL